MSDKVSHPFGPDFRAAYPFLGGKDFGFVRLRGPGLGNLLFPWARALVWAHLHNVPMLAPTWPQLVLGPLLRGERDLRSYSGQFSSDPSTVRGLRRQLAILGCRHVSESGEELRRGIPGAGEIRVFRKRPGHFGPLAGFDALLRRSLTRIVRPEFVPPSGPPFVAVHVRCGDFVKLSASGAHRANETGVPSGSRAPLEWSVQAVTDVRSILGDSIPVHVYSDGSDQELSELLALPGVARSSGAAAITELLEMAQAKCLIGTPHSTFSMWAAFLGNVPLIGFPEAGDKQYGLEFVTRTLDCGERRSALRRRFQP